jgi:hypothetical protein
MKGHDATKITSSITEHAVSGSIAAFRLESVDHGAKKADARAGHRSLSAGFQGNNILAHPALGLHPLPLSELGSRCPSL